MSEPDAWSKLETTELEQKLLDAGRGDRIPSELALRVASALSSSSIAPTVSASAVTHGGLLSTKAGLWGFLSIALLAGAVAFQASGSDSRADATARVAIRAHVLTVPSTTKTAAPTVQTGAPSEPAGSVHAGGVTTRGDSATLREEILVLDRAREALERGALERASSLLEQHRRRFSQGTLVPEAEAMRIETLVRLGDTERAQRMSRRFESAYPAHPLRDRVSALTAGPQPPLRSE